MIEKIVEILKRNRKKLYHHGEWFVKDIAQELHALRYEVARQVIEEYKVEFPNSFDCHEVADDIINWLALQGETITIGRDDK